MVLRPQSGSCSSRTEQHVGPSAQAGALPRTRSARTARSLSSQLVDLERTYISPVWKRSAPAAPVHVAAESVVLVSGSLARIWALLHDPQSATALDEGVVDAWREPGSPAGLGEIQVQDVDVDGTRVRVRAEVTAYDHERRAVLEVIEPHLNFRILSETVVEAASTDVVRVTLRGMRVVPPGRSAVEMAQHQEALDRWAKRVTEVLPEYCRTLS
jgi:hypothetical protein